DTDARSRRPRGDPARHEPPPGSGRPSRTSRPRIPTWSRSPVPEPLWRSGRGALWPPAYATTWHRLPVRGADRTRTAGQPPAHSRACSPRAPRNDVRQAGLHGLGTPHRGLRRVGEGRLDAGHSARCGPEDSSLDALRPGNLVQGTYAITHGIRIHDAPRQASGLRGAGLGPVHKNRKVRSLAIAATQSANSGQRMPEAEIGQGPLSLRERLSRPNLNNQFEVRLMTGRQRGRSIGQVTEPPREVGVQVGACLVRVRLDDGTRRDGR